MTHPAAQVRAWLDERSTGLTARPERPVAVDPGSPPGRAPGGCARVLPVGHAPRAGGMLS